MSNVRGSLSLESLGGCGELGGGEEGEGVGEGEGEEDEEGAGGGVDWEADAGGTEEASAFSSPGVRAGCLAASSSGTAVVTPTLDWAPGCSLDVSSFLLSAEQRTEVRELAVECRAACC